LAPSEIAPPSLHDALPVSFLVAGSHEGPYAGVGIPAFGHHGQGGRIPPGQTPTRARRHRLLDVSTGHHWRHYYALQRLSFHFPDRSQIDPGLFYRGGPGHVGLPHWHRHG